MTNILVNPIIKKKNIITMIEYNRLSNLNEFLLYCDNILEGVSLLNLLTTNNDLLTFKNIVYEPLDQPIYIFSDNKNINYSIKICGTFSRWNLPKDVSKIKNFVDLPDYIFYSLKNKKTILAGENTETASVGNSQWQREGRKLAAAKIGIPFIYQTFYSGKDESQDNIREPNSLQVFNHILYSARYKTPSFVSYFENTFPGSKTKNRIGGDSTILFVNYIKSIIMSDINNYYISTKRDLEKNFFNHMISYLKESKYKKNITNTKNSSICRLKLDYSILNDLAHDGIIDDTSNFIEELLKHIYSEKNNFNQKYPITEINRLNLFKWNSYNNKKNISDLLQYLIKVKQEAKTYIRSGSKVGIANTEQVKNFLLKKFPQYKEDIINKHIDDFEEALIIPLRIHKKSNGVLTFSPDPESGEIVAFSELFGYNFDGSKKRLIIGYCIVDTPKGFDFNSKEGTKLYKAIANYVDILIFDNKQIITNYNLSNTQENNIPISIKETFPNNNTEEVAVVSTYLNQTTIKSDWQLCFIHTHHSSWQQISIFDGKKLQYKKNDRVSQKVDLILQQNNKFMIAEGKDTYNAILSDNKIKKSLINAGQIIDSIYKKHNIKFNTFIYNLSTTPSKDPDYYADCEEKTVAGAIKKGHFNSISNSKDFVVIFVYINKNKKTKFRLIFSDKFDIILKKQLVKEFY